MITGRCIPFCAAVPTCATNYFPSPCFCTNPAPAFTGVETVEARERRQRIESQQRQGEAR